MAASISASKKGLQIIDNARRKKGWIKTEEAWYQLALTSKATLKRFWAGEPIRQDLFMAICKAVGIDNWEKIADSPNNAYLLDTADGKLRYDGTDASNSSVFNTISEERVGLPSNPHSTASPFLLTEMFSDEKIGILRLANSDPFYRPRDIVIKLTNRELFIDCPDEIKESILEIDADFCFNKNTSFNSDSFEDIAEWTEISDLPNLIDKHRKIIGKEFLNKLNNRLPIFNGRKFGIYESHFSNTSDIHEYPNAKLRVFTTDYFTHRVFRSIFYELKDREHPISNANKYDISKYHPFTTSLGINAFVLLRPSHELVLAKRSIFVANTEKPMWHVSVNEGLSQTDIESRQVSLRKCVTRGLNEELGVREERVEDIKFYNFFLVRKNFEIGVTALVEIDLNFDRLVHFYDNAKDSILETEKITVVPFEFEKINNFFQKNYENFSNIAIHSLRVLISKELF